MNEKLNALDIVKTNMRDYSLYIAEGRSYNCILDGAKLAYKRAIYGMHENNSHKVVKVAELAAFALPYHPHPSSISGVIVALGDNGNKLKLMETQGNWGDSSKNIKASADRYIGGYLSDIAEKIFCDSIDHCNFVKGEIDKDEPEALPALLPLCFINGSKGIPSGLPSADIPPLDIIDLIDYYIEILKAKDIDYNPKKYPKPNLELDIISDKSDWDTILSEGKGSLRVAPVMSICKNNSIVINKLPEDKTSDNIKKIISKEILTDKVDFRDESTSETCYVIEKVPHKQCNMKELYNKLYQKLQSNLTYNLCFYKGDKIYISCPFKAVIKENMSYVLETQKKSLIYERNALIEKISILDTIELIKHDDSLRKIIDMSTDEAIIYISNKYNVNSDVANKVMQKPLSYLTKSHLDELANLKFNLKSVEFNINNIFEYMLEKYVSLKKDIKKIIKDKFKPTTFINNKKVKNAKK